MKLAGAAVSAFIDVLLYLTSFPDCRQNILGVEVSVVHK